MQARELKKKNTFCIKAKWHIYNQKISEIKNFEYSAFSFEFNIKEQHLKEEFIEFVDSHTPLLPWDLCNFFIERDIKFAVHYRFVKELGLKGNWVLYNYVRDLRREMAKMNIGKYKP